MWFLTVLCKEFVLWSRAAASQTLEGKWSGWNLAFTGSAVQKLAVTTNILALLYRTAEDTQLCAEESPLTLLWKRSNFFLCQWVADSDTCVSKRGRGLLPLVLPQDPIGWCRAAWCPFSMLVWAPVETKLFTYIEGWRTSSCLVFSRHLCWVLVRLVPRDLSLNYQSGTAGGKAIFFFFQQSKDNISSR